MASADLADYEKHLDLNETRLCFMLANNSKYFIDHYH